MKCPVCNETNHASDAFFCHICGKKLKTKVNGWLICSIVFFISTILLSILTFNYADDATYYSFQYHNIDNMLQEKDEQISNLESQLPHNYYTKFDNQYLYNKCAGNYEKASCYFSEKGSTITIYTTSDGYGLTHIGGWIPMNCLEQH